MPRIGRKSLMLLYWLLCVGLATIFVYFTWPRLESLFGKSPEVASSAGENSNRNTSANEREQGITMGGTYIYATPDRIIIWTTIKLIDQAGNERYLKSLSKDNFTIQESYRGNTYKAPVLNVSSSNVPVRAILVIDQSGSMAESSGIGDLTKMDVVKSAAIFFVDQLTQSSSNSVAILPFSGESIGNSNFLKSPGRDIWWSNEEKRHLEGSISGLRPHGNTPLWQAVSIALDQLSNSQDESYKVIICLSDGLNNRGNVNFDYLLMQAKEKQVPIFTVGYGSDEKLNDKELIALSKESGAGKKQVGSFIRVPPKEWASQLRNIGTDLANLYELYWEPTGAMPGIRVDVDITVFYELSGQQFQTNERRFYTFPVRQP